MLSLLMMMSIRVVAQNNWIDAENLEPFPGIGTLTNPYVISTPGQLAQIADSVNNHNVTFFGKYFSLANNIDLAGKEWTPIGQFFNLYSSNNKPFRGSFKGNNFKIKNVSIGTVDAFTSNAVGLFSYIYNGAIIENLEIESGYVKGYPDPSISTIHEGRAGGIVGFAHCYVTTSSDAILITNCTNNAEIHGMINNVAYVGGVVGSVLANGVGGSTGEAEIVIRHCNNRGILQAQDGEIAFMGGIIGTVNAEAKENTSGSATAKVKIEYCTNEGNIYTKGTFAYGAGIVAGAYSDANGLSVNSNVTRTTSVEILYAENAGNVKAEGESTYLGGILAYGYITANYNSNNMRCNIHVKQSVNRGNIDGESLSGAYTGGIVGWGACFAEYGDVNAMTYAGNVQNEFHITDNLNYGLVKGKGREFTNTGGIVGSIISSASENDSPTSISGTARALVVIESCQNNESVMAEGAVNTFTGGIVGIASALGTCRIGSSLEAILKIRYCQNNHDIFASGTQNFYTGGIAGYLSANAHSEMSITGSADATIALHDSYHYGAIKTTGQNAVIGGIVGELKVSETNDQSTSIDSVAHCYSYGNLIAHEDDENSFVAGIVGYIQNDVGTVVVTNALATNFQIRGVTAHRIVGGNSGGLGTISLSGNIAGKETFVNDLAPFGTYDDEEGFTVLPVEIASEELYTTEPLNWDFTTVWALRGDTTYYPYFRWQSAPVRVMELNKYDISLNLKNAADSTVYYTQDGDSYTFTGQSSGIHQLDFPGSKLNDTLYFTNYENALWHSYVVSEIYRHDTSTINIPTIEIEDKTIQLYPNPTHGSITVKIEDYQNVDELLLFDIYGRILSRINVENVTTSIDLTHYSSGIYLINVLKNERIVKSLKVVKR